MWHVDRSFGVRRNKFPNFSEGTQDLDTLVSSKRGLKTRTVMHNYRFLVIVLEQELTR